jgi:DNA-binding XRE family transcriptional regulator
MRVLWILKKGGHRLGLDAQYFALGMKLLRRRHDLTQLELAEKSSIHIKTIQRVEAGNPCHLDTALAISRALGTGLEEVLQWGHATERANDAD